MRLKSIKLAGFKSFVEPTNIPVPGNLIGIVGPNGCGKSNIIDAVRWVMGESSAKHLRGDSMADVIFNGSNSRKPVGKASVELIFDNGDGGAGGQYASYAEISIRREAGRDGLSDYFLNRTRCRRKDITDLFLGTGLGPRAYSIIEQGMVTRVVEAKPEDLRGFIEEAAGISKYKERRRETENRIRHARENLARVEDIRKELGIQLQRLQKQSKAAARYKQLKEDERLVRAQLLTLRWRGLNARLQEQSTQLSQTQTALDAALAAQRATEAEIEKFRSRQLETNEAHNAVQAEFYSIGAEISRLEQAIEHARETRGAQQRELDQLNLTWNDASTHLQNDLKRLEEIGRNLEGGAPLMERGVQERDSAREALQAAERTMHSWQADWDEFNAIAAEPAKTRDIQTARIRQLERHIEQFQERQTRLHDEAQAIESELQGESADALRDEALELDRACTDLEASLAKVETAIREARDKREEASGKLDDVRGRFQSCEARLAGLNELQAAVEARHDDNLNDWLRRHNLENAPRLAGRLSVEPGWERAAERVLGAGLGAVCVTALDPLSMDAAGVKSPPLTLFDLAAAPVERRRTGDMLLDKLGADVDLTSLIGGVYVAETLADAWPRRGGLDSNETIVTRDGSLIGRNWLSLGTDGNGRAGWLERRREIDNLGPQATGLRAEVDQWQTAVTQAAARLQDAEHKREELVGELNARQRQRAELRERLGHKQERLAQLESRRSQLRREQDELNGQADRDQAEIVAAGELLRQAEAVGSTYGERREELRQTRNALQDKVEQARLAEAEARDAMHRLEVERQSLQTAFESTRASISRLEGQLRHVAERREELQQALVQDNQPDVELRRQLEEFLQQRLSVETRLTEARQAVADLDTELRAKEQERGRQEKQVQAIRETLEGERVARQELLVRRDTLAEQVREAGFELEDVLQDMPEEADEPAWQEKSEQIARRIDRLGPINLVAIEEFEEQSERKTYLDRQNEDLSQALGTLEEAIRKIDRETRTRFKHTYDKVNENFQNFFPQLFGGGNAYLDLTDSDLLETGVSVMARPPGKRNSNIHLLSGGEKALTAVALLFAIFELNPAPFCLLDEVDAPLDDANVERYSETLKTLSQRTQLVYVTHNKISMEMADVLIGVTMSEPGVSRLVTVDVEEALEMVAQ